MRPETRLLKNAITAIAAFFALFYFYTSGFGVFSTETNRGVYLLMTYLLCLLIYPAVKGRPKNRMLLCLDGLILILSVVCILYWIIEYPEYAAKRVGLPNQWDLFFGIVLIVISLEITRRAMGNTLMILGLVLILQTYLGPHLPGIFTHKGISLSRIIEFNFFIDGIFGTIVSVYATYVMPFLVFGAFLQRSGGGDFFIDLATALAGNIPGGPALIAVVGSAIFGSISGSPVANVMATGAFTIPMMQRVGYKPEFAGAVEAAASTGGSFLPPIMGAAAFILATLTETPYGQIMLMALLPALLYFLSIGLMVYFRARRRILKGLEQGELPRVSDVIRRGWYYAFTIVVLAALIIKGYSPPVTAFGASLFVIFCSMFRKESRFTLRKFIDTLESAGTSSLVIGSTAGTLGLVMGGMTLSGLGLKFSAMLLSFSGNNLFLMILLVILIATIIGMGLTITASYIILAILAAPSLIMLGVPTVQAHLLCFWLSMTSNLTPPVCVAAFAAASISGGDAMKTGLHAFVLGIFMYLMPFAFVYVPQILIVGHSFLSVLEIAASYILATVALAAAFQGWLLRPLNWRFRIVCLGACLLLATPELLTDIAGLLLLGAVLVWNYRTRKKELPPEARSIAHPLSG
ncbi:MAG: TRAP transporter fused permease subunit [Desulfobacteraceae bacterium]|nr:MAG: TRAP transporter fused permease subunit [Desulfobacteraceae bacterium]